MASAQQQSMQQWQQVLRRYFKIEGPLLSLAVYADKFLLFNRGHFGWLLPEHFLPSSVSSVSLFVPLQDVLGLTVHLQWFYVGLLETFLLCTRLQLSPTVRWKGYCLNKIAMVRDCRGLRWREWCEFFIIKKLNYELMQVFHNPLLIL